MLGDFWGFNLLRCKKLYYVSVGVGGSLGGEREGLGRFLELSCFRV